MEKIMVNKDEGKIYIHVWGIKMSSEGFYDNRIFNTEQQHQYNIQHRQYNFLWSLLLNLTLCYDKTFAAFINFATCENCRM